MPKKDHIKPTGIEHKIDDFREDSESSTLFYNFIMYHFEGERSYIWARSYLDDIGTIAVCGPFVRKGSIETVEDSDNFSNVVDYLKRRYSDIRAMGEEGYVSIWRGDGALTCAN